MDIFDFEKNQLMDYHWCGKFTSPNEKWKHEHRTLSDFELLIVTDGVLYIAVNENQYALTKGQFLLSPKDSVQQGYDFSNCSFYWMHFDLLDNDKSVSYVEGTKTNIIPTKEHIYVPITGSLISIERMLIFLKLLVDSDRRYSEINLNTYLACSVITEISNQVFNSFHKIELKNATNSELLLNDVYDYVTRRIFDVDIIMDLKVRDIAEKFGYNEKYLTTVFKKQFGISIKQFILIKKVEKAKILLTDTDLPISKIAYNVNCNDVHNFSNLFKRITGISPSSFRNCFSKRYLFDGYWIGEK